MSSQRLQHSITTLSNRPLLPPIPATTNLFPLSPNLLRHPSLPISTLPFPLQLPNLKLPHPTERRPGQKQTTRCPPCLSPGRGDSPNNPREGLLEVVRSSSQIRLNSVPSTSSTAVRKSPVSSVRPAAASATSTLLAPGAKASSESEGGLAILSIQSAIIVRSWTDLFCSSLIFLLRLQKIKEETEPVPILAPPWSPTSSPRSICCPLSSRSSATSARPRSRRGRRI
jgi:hypothetical protein